MVRAALRVPLPEIGDFAVAASSLELRHALDPGMWARRRGGGTVRYVDSSVERVQVKSGHGADRYVLTCNGEPVPLQPTGSRRVRRRRALPRLAAPSCLHPTIGVHAPLVFDLVDTWMQRSWAVASTTWPIRAAQLRPSRSTPSRPKAAAWRASSAWPYAGQDGRQGANQRRASVYARLAAFLTPDSRLFPAGNLHAGRAHALILMARTLLAIYLQSPRRYDEMLAADGGAAALAKVLRSS
jgi:hypothetical protein